MVPHSPTQTRPPFKLDHYHMGQPVSKSSLPHFDGGVPVHDQRTPAQFLHAKQVATDTHYPRLPTRLQVPAPHKLQRVTKHRRYLSTMTIDENLRLAVYDFFSVVHGSFATPPVPDADDVAADSALNHISPVLNSLFHIDDGEGEDFTSAIYSDADYEGDYSERRCSFPLFAQATIARVDVIVGCLPLNGLAFYIADVAPVRTTLMQFVDICYLTDLALCTRKYARSHIRLAKELYRIGLMENRFHGHNNQQGELQMRCKYEGETYVQCVCCELAKARDKVLRIYDNINNNGDPTGDSDTGDEE